MLLCASYVLSFFFINSKYRWSLSLYSYRLFNFCILNLRRELGESKLRFDSMKKTIARRTSKNYPRNVKSAEAIAVEFKNPKTFNEFGLNLRKTEPFYIGTVEVPSKYSFTVFASKQVMSLIDRHISDDRHYMMDGTFDVTPLGCYYQLLVIHIEYQNDVSHAFQQLRAKALISTLGKKLDLKK